jgi:hypothetical protein
LFLVFGIMTHPHTKLSLDQFDRILNRFPHIELSYETVSHKKVSEPYDICLAIPQSKKYYAWFSFFQNTDVCFIMELSREKKIISISVVKTLFHPDLSLGTVLYGSIVDADAKSDPSAKFFVVEDIFYYKGVSLKRAFFGEKLGFIREMMHKYTVQRFQPPVDPQENLDGGNMVFALPAMWHLSSSTEDRPVAGYAVHHTQYRATAKTVPYLNELVSSKKTFIDAVVPPQLTYFGDSAQTAFPPTQPNPANQPPQIRSGKIQEHPPAVAPEYQPLRKYCDYNKPQYKFPAIFQVSADLQYDIYHLHIYSSKNKTLYYDMAHIPNYKTSVFMNGLFRKIRENKNVDLTEESDDEEDFQDCLIDKYVDLSKKILIECVFNKKFKRWTPVRIVNDRHAKIVNVPRLLHDNYRY